MTQQTQAAPKQTQEEKDKIITEWLRDSCPSTLKGAGGGLVSADVERVGHFIVLNYDGVISDDALNSAVTNLWNVLTKFSNKPEDCVFRGRYAPPLPPPADPYAGMTDEALREAGLKRGSDGQVIQMTSEDYRRHNEHPETHKDEKPPTSITELKQRIAKKFLDQLTPEQKDAFNPWKTKADALYVQLRNGNMDHRLTEDLRQVFARRGGPNGPIDWERTYQERRKLLDKLDTVRNQDFRFVSKRPGQ